MALTTHHPAHVRNIIATGAEWYLRDQSGYPIDLNRQCEANKLIEFKQDTVDISVAVLVSAGCSHIAVVEADASKRKIKVTVYYLNSELVEQWSTNYQAPQSEFKSDASFSFYETATLHGGVTEDGQNVLLVYRPKAVATRAYLVNPSGFTWRKPPSDNDRSYSSCIGIVSEDSEYLFYVRSAARFGRGGEAKAVEAYSIRHLACARAETFGFGDRRNLRNVRLLRQINLRAPIYMAIDTSSFTGDDTSRRSPPLIVSSDGSLHWNFSGIDMITSTGGQNCFISPDNVHLFYVEPDTAMLHHWDLKKLSLKSLGSVRLPGVEYAHHRTWLIRGQETRIKDSIAEQSHQVRYSPKCKTITVVTVNDSSIVVNVLSTYNLQLIYHETIKDSEWPPYVPAGIGFNDTTGLNIFAMFPAEIASTSEGHLRLFGIKAILISLPEVFKKVKAIEQYFDHVGERILALPEQVACKRDAPLCTFAWKPGVMDRNDEFAIPLVHGEAIITNAEDARRQNDIYTSVYAHPSLSWRQQDRPVLRRFFVPHLFSFTYPWAPHQRVSIFGVIMKNEYHIISVGPPASTLDSGADVVTRVLYASDTKISKDETEYIEVFRTDCHHVIRIYNKSNGNSSYSGAPMPIPRWTAMTPHFLEEDAWYDTFIIHRGAHVTMPGGSITTPNIAITNSTSFYAYLPPRTSVAQDEVNYGLRTRSAYVMPKHILWKQYGLRGLRVDNLNDIFFGGGRYADFLGSYFRGIYEDKSYDDSSPLFPSTFAMACNENYRSQKTTHIDAFFRRSRQDKGRLLENSVAITCALPLACKARPGATLSFMRYIALYPWFVNDIGAVQVKRGAAGPRIPAWDNTQYKWLYQTQNIWLDVQALFGATTQAVESEPNKTLVTLPLAGFCSFGNKLYKPPPVRHRDSFDHDGCFWEFILATTPYEPDPSGFPRQETWLASSVARSGKGPASPFTRLVEGILDMKHRDLQLSYLRVVWLEKLLAWKMHTFGRRVYLTRMALPMLVLLVIHLIVGILLTNSDESADSHINWSVILLASIEGIVSCFILSVSLRQAYRIPRVFLRSIFHYIDFTALSLGLAMFLQIVIKHPPSRAFLGFSTLVIWIAAILILRIYKRVGILLLLVTEAIQEVFSFLVLVFFIILGFAFVPFLLLRNTEMTDPTSNPWSSLSTSFAHILNFISSDYSALEPFQNNSAAVRTIRALYIVIITVLCLNILIAMLNLKIKRADKNAANLYHLQMAALQIEIELDLLSSSERGSRHWFPQWFTYSLTETERRVWEDYIDKNKLKWDEENDFDESKDNAPLSPPSAKSERQNGDAAIMDPTAQPAGANVVKNDPQSINSDTEASPAPENSTSPSTNPHTTEAPTPLHSGPSTNPSATTKESTKSRSSHSQQSLLDEPIPTAEEKLGASAVEANSRDNINSLNGATVRLACKICGSPGMICQGCQLVAYCGKEHQRQDWRSHKTACKGKAKA